MALKLPKLPFQLPMLGPRTRKAVGYFGLLFLGLFVFVFAVQCTFPYDRVKDKVIETLQDKYDVTIGGVEPGIWPGRVYFNAVSIRTRQTKPEETITTFYIEKLQLDLGLLAAAGGDIQVDLDAKIGAGHLAGSLKLEKFGRGSIHADFVGVELPGASLPLRGALGLPMTGKLEFNVSLYLPKEKSKTARVAINWQKARGSFALGCPTGCTFGDGKTKLKPLLKNSRQQVMVADGIDFGKITMDSLAAKATLKGGQLALEQFDAKSRDGELKVEYSMKLEKDFDESMVTGCLRFKASDTLLTREPKTHAAISTTGAERRADGFFHIRLTDRFKDMKRLNQECGPGASNAPQNNDSFVRDMRPNLTATPPDQGSSAPPPSAPPPSVPTPPVMPDAATALPTAGSAGSGSATTIAPPPPMPPNEGAPRGEGERRGDDDRNRKPSQDTPDGSAQGSAPGAAPAPAQIQ